MNQSCRKVVAAEQQRRVKTGLVEALVRCSNFFPISGDSIEPRESATGHLLIRLNLTGQLRLRGRDIPE